MGTSAEHLEGNLLEITSLAHKWGAIILIFDEADVYLAERSLQDIQRNSLVSVFLRHLEYFQGIMFLTTNRVATFDMAFQSRIRFSIKFGDLGRDAKKKNMEDFLEESKDRNARVRKGNRQSKWQNDQRKAGKTLSAFGNALSCCL